LRASIPDKSPAAAEPKAEANGDQPGSPQDEPAEAVPSSDAVVGGSTD
jgi:hypothetical protein